MNIIEERDFCGGWHIIFKNLPKHKRIPANRVEISHIHKNHFERHLRSTIQVRTHKKAAKKIKIRPFSANLSLFFALPYVEQSYNVSISNYSQTLYSDEGRSAHNTHRTLAARSPPPKSVPNYFFLCACARAKISSFHKSSFFAKSSNFLPQKGPSRRYRRRHTKKSDENFDLSQFGQNGRKIISEWDDKYFLFILSLFLLLNKFILNDDAEKGEFITFRGRLNERFWD